LIHQLHPAVSPQLRATHGLSLAIFPTHFFYSFLYYTDIVSVFLVLLCYSYSLPFIDLVESQKTSRHSSSSFHLSAAAGFLAVLFRQTNIIWVIYVLGEAVLRDHVLLKTQHNRAKLIDIITLLKNMVYNWKHTLHRYISYLCVILMFFVFIVINDGIVVGDKVNHQPVLHLAQGVYMTAFGGAPLCLGLLSYIRGRRGWTVYGLVKSIIICIGIDILFIWIIEYHSYIHPFLLADNRHYFFYLIKEFKSLHPYGYLLVTPVYSVLTYLFISRLVQARGALWILLYCGGMLVVLVPTPLVEPRYFTLPFLIAHLQLIPDSLFQSRIALGTYTCMNIVTVGVFLLVAFEWSDGSLARFMW
jgi:alpha-1,2-glucosyltransferase